MAEMGKDGFIAFGTSSGGASTAPSAASNYLDAWSVTPDAALADVTAFGSSGRAFLPTIRGWKATAAGTLDMDVSTTGAQGIVLALVGTTVVNLPIWCRFKTSTGGYTGPAILTGATINSKVADKVSISYSITGTSYLQQN